MIVSHQKNLIYCRLPKSASTSFSAALAPFADPFPRSFPARMLRRIGLEAMHPRLFDFRHHSHLSLMGAREVLSEPSFRQAMKLTVVRHPVSWVYSYYTHLLRDSFPAEYAAGFHEVRAARSFDYFLDWLTERPRRPISTQLIDEKGNYLVDAVVRCENLAEEAATYLAPHGIRVSVSVLNAGNYQPPTFSSSQIEKIVALYQGDMAAFGYGENGALTQPDLRPNAATRQVASDLGRAGLAHYDCWKPFPSLPQQG
ncbi:sulfotransferase family protein [Aliiroseovarius crassostreae]|uniref:sulfotransferase family protein n=1 Tax=Aliiroseovarius crassostreae TaxID=154981 RepID=UPI0021FB44FD|nr:sulfotransferase family protein [Aliiroseovarius crassostreae]UWQ01522.1 sulfotransferase family protein [Aliiroseovarius crassostreae]